MYGRILFALQVLFFAHCLAPALSAQEQPRFALPTSAANGDLSLQFSSGTRTLLERTSDLRQWHPVGIFGSGETQYVDTAAAFRSNGFYRAHQESDTNRITGDSLETADGPVTIHPVNHASFVLQWNGRMIYNDPVGGGARYASFPRADLVLVSHDHSDHYDRATLNAIRHTNTVMIVPRAVYNTLTADLKALATVLTNGASTNVLGLQIDAVPAYSSNHPKGTGNGYILTLGGKRLYMSGDTGAISEMANLSEIDVAFVSMNVPFTMNVTQAAAIVRQFGPKVVYPYHYRNQDGTFADLNSFRSQLGTDQPIEVRPRKWY
jgi:L-ascorbate metabolism protein UlaG (beta-lactamase superfamily)